MGMFPICSCNVPATIYAAWRATTFQASESQMLEEVPEEVHTPKIDQQLRELLTASVLGLSNVGVEIT